MDHVKIGFVGAGNIATKHLNELQDYPDVTVEAFCDVNIDTALKKSAEFTKGYARVYDSHEKMLDNHELDAIYICIPPSAHGAIERTACERGVHMFIEKPIHLELEDAIIIEDHIRQNNIITSVGYHWRYNPPNIHAKSLLVANSHILGVQGSWIGMGPDTPWWYNENVSGGQHHEQTTHLFDTIRYLLGVKGRDTQVQGFARKGWVKLGKDLHFVTALSTINLEFPFGAIATITSCCYSNTNRVQLEFFAEKLYVVLGSEGNQYIKNNDDAKPLNNTTDTDSIDRVFIDAVKTQNSANILSDYSDALNTLRLTCAATESFENDGRTIVV